MQPQTFVTQLKGSNGSDTITIDPTSTGSSLEAGFRFDNIDARLQDGWLYGLFVRFWIRFTVDQPASGGSIIRPDQLYRVIKGTSLKSDDIGQLYQPGDMNGPQLGLVAQIVSNNYRLPYLPRADIPAADGDTAVTLPVVIPLAHMCFHKGHQTGIWNGFLKNNGEVKLLFNDQTALAAVSTGAVTKATFDVRAELIYSAEKEARPPVFWHWRTRTTPPNETKHTIRNVCQGQGITGATGEGKIAFLAYLSDQNGLGGADGVDNIQRVFLRDRGQPTFNLGSPFYGVASSLASFIEQTRVNNIFAAVQSGAYPLALGTAVDGAPNVASAYYWPAFWPHVGGQQVSKCQRWSGDYNVEFDYAVTPTGSAVWMSLEEAFISQQQEDYLTGERMKLPPDKYVSYPKVDRQLHDAGGPQGQKNQADKLAGLPKKLRSR